MIKLPKRKSTRLRDYDYSTPGAYFVTICTKDRECILSKIVVGEGFHALLQNILTPIGQEVEKTIQYIGDNYIGTKIDKYIIMPNHIHLIVSLENTGGRGNPPLQNITGQLKSFVMQKCGENIWQRSFHDHIIRGDADYKQIWEYIDTNHLKWEKDCFYNE